MYNGPSDYFKRSVAHKVKSKQTINRNLPQNGNSPIHAPLDEHSVVFDLQNNGRLISYSSDIFVYVYVVDS